MENITTVEYQPTEFLSELQTLISGHLQSDESILFSCQTLHQDSPFIKGPNAYGQIVTERRVVQAIINKFLHIEHAPGSFIFNAGYASGIRNMMKQNGGNGNFAGSMLLNDIVGLQTSTLRLHCSSIKVLGLGGTELEFFFALDEIRQKFLAVLQKAMDNVKPNTSNGGSNIEKRLEELTRLHKNGFITEIEYESKRKEILNQL